MAGDGRPLMFVSGAGHGTGELLPAGPDRKLGEYTLPEGWAIIAAGNRDSDRGVTIRMPTPLRNRFAHLEFQVDVQEWSEWAIQAGIRPEVIAFLRFRPELLSQSDRDAHAFPSPRS